MRKTQFDEFFKRQRPKKETSEIDRAAKREEWIAHLEERYRSVESFLESYIRDGQIQFSYGSKDISEELSSGGWLARKWHLGR